MDAAITTTRVGATSYLAPTGSLLDDATLDGLKGAFDECIGQRRLNLLLDLAKVTLIGGRALELILDARATVETLGGRLKLANPSDLAKDILRATGVDNHVSVVDISTARTVRMAAVEWQPVKRKLGDILVERGLIKREQLVEATRLQAESGKRIGAIVVERRWVSETDLLRALSEQCLVPFIALRPGMYDPAATASLDIETARRCEVLPMFRVHETLTIATNDPLAVPDLDHIARHSGCRLRPVLARREDILKHLSEAYRGSSVLAEFATDVTDDLQLIEQTIPDDYTAIDEMAAGSPVINLVNGLMQRALRDQVSDIHIEPGRTRSRVRFRIDGVLYEVMAPPAEMHPAIVSRLKVMANLDIAERRMPQDGRLQVALRGRSVDMRFSSLPGIFGEKIVLRVLDRNNSILEIDRLGMSQTNLERLEGLLVRSHGLILVTGPTGSGKTTTLYAAVNRLRSLERNIVTIEDPVEYQLDLVNQNQVNDAIGLSFARLLRHVLRQDPDIIMVGEIRDRPTAEIAVQAALTGHLVLSTLHTNDAVAAVARLVEMGIEPYLLSSALIGVMAQRLLRRVCTECATSYVVMPDVLSAYGRHETAPVRLSRGRGCASCYDSGYKGRLAIHELFDLDAELQSLVVRNAGRDEMNRYLRQRGVVSLRDDGVERALRGETTLEEIARAIHG
jgi:type IV pilus assembly protein PilB